MRYSFKDIEKIVGGKMLSRARDMEIRNVIFDTRKISFAENSVFFAFKGAINDGHDYLDQAYRKGIRNFIVSRKVGLEALEGANVLLVHSSLQALQKLAAHHRSLHKTRIIAITGSNGKTIVKEWLGKALSVKYRVVKSPKSYNSQIGVALSLLQIDSQDEFAVIEAGISRRHEMRFLERMIKPEIGIFTNLGDAHSSGFDSKEEKLEEKLTLFAKSDTIIYCKDQYKVRKAIERRYSHKTLSWAEKNEADMRIVHVDNSSGHTILQLRYKEQNFSLNTGLKSPKFLENLMHVISCLAFLGYSPEEIQKSVDELDQVANRLELRDGINSNLLINDSYSLDMASMQLALEFQDLHAEDMDKVLVFTDFQQQSNKKELYEEVNRLIEEKKISRVFVLGIDEQYHSIFSGTEFSFFDTPEQLISDLGLFKIRSSCILIKGARKYHLENLFHKLSRLVHETVLETSFSALDHNLNVYKSYLEEKTRIMAVIKADAYGSGSVRMAQYLEQKNIDYLAVAIVDEAVQIRSADCNLPIMVFNVHNDQIDLLWDNRLEPEVYSLELLDELLKRARRISKPLDIHIKLETGMHRLGFEEDQIKELIVRLKSEPLLRIKSIFSHLSGSENPQLDTITKDQISRFFMLASNLEEQLGYSCLKHILNTGGIIRFGKYQADMVRLGLGLYGIDETGLISDKLEKVHRLKARVLQIKMLKPGESTGYGRYGTVEKETRIAVISIGYADGLMRISGKNKYKLKVKDKLCPLIGHVCMDVCMIDISSVPDVQPGDEVVIFDSQLPLEDLAETCETISYEIISRIAPRVKRSYTYD